MKAGIGQALRRKEDLRLVRGKGRYSDDVHMAGQAYAWMVRSVHAHACIRAIATDAARALPGVVAVFTAKEAADRVAVDYDIMPCVTSARSALDNGAPRLHREVANLCIDADAGDAGATAQALAQAAHVVRIETWIQRVTGVPMEPRAAVAAYDPATGRYHLHAGSGGIVRQKQELAAILGVPPDAVRVTANEIGGNFGTRNAFFPEFALVAWAAKRIGRPVKWTCERQEAFLSDYQGRDLFVEAELALDADGHFLALRASNISNVGAHTVSFVPLTKGVSVMSSVYHIPAARVRARAVMSNTPPTNPYRSAGRAEVMFVMERLIDLAASTHGFDRIELRRRNLIRADEMPYVNPLGLTYDSGEYARTMASALALGRWDDFPQRRRAAARSGKRRGIGIANYIEFTTGAPREWTKITVLPEGRVDVAIGTLSSGQGHRTSFAQLITDWLGVPFDCVNLIQGDTDIVPVGGGSHSGRSMRLAGIVIGSASDALIARAKRIAAHVLEAAEHDIEFFRGNFLVKGTDRSIGIFDVAREALGRNDLADELAGPLAAESDETVTVGGCPYGSHVCEVEVDLELGTVEIVVYAAVDDVGRAVNPRILHGQTHGAIAQGIGQALNEGCVYDRNSAQLLSGSFMDYAIPRARDLLSFATEISEVPSPNNPLGVRAGGEGGTTPALAVVVNAIVDAL